MVNSNRLTIKETTNGLNLTVDEYLAAVKKLNK